MIRRSSSRRVQEAIGSSKKRFSRYRAPDTNKATKQQPQPEEMPSIHNNGSVAGDYNNNECQSVYSAFCPTENENMSIYAYSLGGSSINGDKSLVLDLDDDDDDNRSFHMPAPVKKRYEACDTAPKLPGTEHGPIPMNINIGGGSQQFHDSVRSMWTSGYDEEDPAVEEPFEEPLKPQSYHTETDDSSFCESSHHTPQSPAAQSSRVSFRAPAQRTSASSTGRPRPSLVDCYAQQAQSTPAIMVGGADNDEPSALLASHKKEKKSHKRSSFWTSMRFGGGAKKIDKKDKLKEGSNHKIKDGSNHSHKDNRNSSMFLSFRKTTRTKTVKVSLKKTTQKKSHRPQPEEEEYRSERRASF